ncbi:MAG: ABC transporter permease [Nocardia sp.]|nr:ABC transporter permease [Nocardia sp.]
MLLPTIPRVPTEVNRAANSEFRKIIALRTGWWMPPVLAAVGFVATSVSASVGSGPQERAALATGTVTVGLYIAIAIAAVCGVWRGASLSGDEYRHHSISLTALSIPDRTLLFGAKVGVAAGYSVVSMLCAEAGALLALLAFGRGKAHFGWQLAGVFGGGLLAALCWGAIGAGLGLLLRSTTLATIAVAGWLMLLEPLIWLVAKAAGVAGLVTLLPGSATVGTVAVGSFADSPFLPPNAASAVVLVLWTLASGTAAWWYLRGREI